MAVWVVLLVILESLVTHHGHPRARAESLMFQVKYYDEACNRFFEFFLMRTTNFALTYHFHNSIIYNFDQVTLPLRGCLSITLVESSLVYPCARSSTVMGWACIRCFEFFLMRTTNFALTHHFHNSKIYNFDQVTLPLRGCLSITLVESNLGPI